MFRHAFRLAPLAAVLLWSCGSAPTASKSSEPLPAPPPETADAGTITGRIVYSGDPVQLKPISMDATPACARLHSGPVYSEEAIVGTSGGVKNTIVWIKSGLPRYAWPAPKQSAKLDQRGCVYVPHVMAIRTGQTLEIANSDNTNHNVHSMPSANPAWNESQPPLGDVKQKIFDSEEMPPVPFKCNVHPWMRAYIGVISHPFFAVTGEDGTFRIEGVPPGEYVIEAWHEKFGTREQKVRIEPKQAVSADFEYKG